LGSMGAFHADQGDVGERTTKAVQTQPLELVNGTTNFGPPNVLLLSGERPSRAGIAEVAGCELRGGSAAGPANGRSSAPAKSYAARATWTAVSAGLRCVKHASKVLLPPIARRAVNLLLLTMRLSCG